MNRGSKPRLAANEVVEITNPNAISVGLDSAQHDVEVPPSLGERATALLRAIVGVSVVGALLGGIIYLSLAATVLIATRVDGVTSVAMRGAYPVGQVPEGATVLVSTEPAATSVTDKLVEGLMGPTGASVVRVVAGPGAEVRTDLSGQIVVNEKASGIWAAVDARDLDRQYLAICLRGGCAAGEAVLVGERSVVGKVRDVVGLTSLETPEPPRSIFSASAKP